MYSTTTIALGVSLLATLSYAGELNKPPLRDNLDYLQPALMDNFPSVHSTWDEWGDGWIPKYCLDEISNADNGYNLDDITTYNIHYEDCGTGWVVCVHKDSPMPIDVLADLFGRVPVHARQWIKHVVSLPDDGGSAYMSDNSIVMQQINEHGFEVFLHETGHSLDASAYNEGKLSSSDHYHNEYNQDPNIPDPYSGATFAENVAQATVIAAYNAVVPGGYGTIEPRWGDVHHQYATVQTWQRESGNLLVPGGTCTERLPNSETVPLEKPNKGRLVRGRGEKRRSEKPDTSLGDDVKVLSGNKYNSGRCGAGIDSAAWGSVRSSK
ncbi:MAG: hypothetical protein Q9166_003792 [cf. Caloplaca sp. 2 TL-2023]